ncbi:hypothetical protein [Limnoglobus roseus]|uniref:Uncharacterized protein n=1 Tax=Limnoglobus roseus TaxID=2598579 RepID=A0A5C1AKJ4_9BACT|nr:hypothetical protein [Limnoglobus roseus]QEL18723.1 hypothetical protein PX52LOC_05759 [Limnoglobus roseus]
MSKKTTKADEAETEAQVTEAAAAEESTEGLVKMHKNGEHLHVHPTTVEAHKAAGWQHA